jgi:hypothetical protein
LNDSGLKIPILRDNSFVTEKSRKEINGEPKALTAEDYEDAGYQDINPQQCEVLRQYTLHIIKKLITASNLQDATQDFYLKFKCWLEARSATGAQVGNATLEFEPGYYGVLKFEDAIAAVLAHEISHHLLKHEHLIHQLQDNYLKELKSGTINNPQDEDALFANYKKFEIEADINVIPMLLNAGYSVAGAFEMNATMDDRDEVRKTHPSPNQRKSMMLAEAKSFGADLNAPMSAYPASVLEAIDGYFAEKKIETHAPIKHLREKTW